VQLGALLPADVHVDISRRDVEPGSSDGGALRLWSVQSYRNGAFVFEAAATDQEIDDSILADLIVRVRPAGSDRERALASAVVAPLRFPGTGPDQHAARELLDARRLAG
jgi:hypothetical protein